MTSQTYIIDINIIIYKECKFFCISQKIRHYENLRKILTSTFIYKPTLIKLYMNANIVKMQDFYLMVFEIRGHWRAQVKNPLFFDILFVWNLSLEFGMDANIMKTKFFTTWSLTSKVIEGHFYFCEKVLWFFTDLKKDKWMLRS